MIKNGGFPLLGSTVKGKFIDEDNPEDWDVVALIRYRSVKDMMNMMIEMSETDLSQHKWASIEKTHVFPAQIQISLFLPRNISDFDIFDSCLHSNIDKTN